jgi:ribosomal protein L37AE/L43A
MDSIPAQTETCISDSTERLLSAYEISLRQDTRMFSPKKNMVNPKAGDICPRCQAATIDYNKLLNLSCPGCGYTLAGCST